MKFTSVNVKLNIAIVAISLVSIFVAAMILFNYEKKIATDIYINTQKDLIRNSKEKIASKMRVGITNAISIANDERIKNAFIDNDRECAIKSFTDISKKMRAYTAFKNIKIHLHTKNNLSFVRNWKPEKYGDDLSSFRDAVVYVNKTKESVTTFEPGRAGLLLRAITPVIDEKGNHYGSLEFIQGINSVVKSFDKLGIGFLLLMDKKVNEKMKIGKNFSFKEDKKFKNFIISQKFINKDFLADAKTLDMQQLFKNGFIKSEKYFYTYSEVKNFKNKRLGITLLAKPLEEVNKAVDGAQTLIYISLFGILAMMFIINIVIMLAVRKLITKPLKIFENGLLDFFLFLQGKKDFTQNIEINTNDEFGVMAKSLQENIAVSAKLHEEINYLNTNLEKEVEDKTTEVVTLLDNADQGFLSFGDNLQIDNKYSKECVKIFKKKIGGLNIADLLYKVTNNKKDFFVQTLQSLLHETNKMKIKTIISLLQNEFIINKKAISVQYKILDNGKFMLIFTDITQNKILEKKINRERNILKMVVAVVSDSEEFFELVNEFNEFIDSIHNVVDMSKTPLNNVNELYREIHTFKGLFSQKEMSNIVKNLHKVESSLSDLLVDKSVTNEELQVMLDENDFGMWLGRDINIVKDVLGDALFAKKGSLVVKEECISQIEQKIVGIAKKYDENEEYKSVMQDIKNLKSKTFASLFHSYPKLIDQLSTRLDKSIYPLQIIVDDDLKANDEMKSFIKSLVHVFRNSVDHGIESMDERAEIGKDEIGTISCTIRESSNNIHIIIADDGAGLDIEKIKQKASTMGIATEGLKDKEIEALIFHDNFSTKDEISQTSGRGVGMAAVKHEVELLNGIIKIISQKNIGTTIEFIVPV